MPTAEAPKHIYNTNYPFANQVDQMGKGATKVNILHVQQENTYVQVYLLSPYTHSPVSVEKGESLFVEKQAQFVLGSL